jgi:hypothetical protein
MLAVEFFAIHHKVASTIELPTPTVAGAGNRAPLESPGAGCQTSTPMATTVEEGLELLLSAPHDEDRFMTDLVLDERPHLDKLILATSHLPDSGPESLRLESRKFPR